MANRLSKIYTRTGDQGTTGLTGGERVDKDDPRIEAIGAVDELSSVIGLVMTEPLPDTIRHCLTDVQHTLFDLGGELSMPGHALIAQARIDELEQMLDALNADLSPLKEFILPGGTRAAAAGHLARSVCRRAERRLVTLTKNATGSDLGRRYINRLSDLLFVMCRSLNHAAGEPDVLWRHQRKKKA